ncbi:MAG: 1-acyl-sn-glycerol-3-phosphate acyltransferase [Thermodesulfobacteriota bacterium]
MIKRIRDFFAAAGRLFVNGRQRLFGGTHNHFLCFLPSAQGPLSGRIFDFLFARVTVNDELIDRVRALHENGIIVYAGKYKSRMEYLFCNRQYEKHGLPAPELAFGYRFIFLQPLSRLLVVLLAHIDHLFTRFSFLSPYKNQYFKEELTNGRSAFFSLFGNTSFYSRLVRSKNNPSQELIALQKTLDRPIYIFPQNMFFSRRPVRKVFNVLDFLFGGLTEKPGALRRLFMLISRSKNIFIEMSDPINLLEFLGLPEIRELSGDNQALALRRRLLSDINRLRQRVTGPVIKSREEIKESVMGSLRLQSFVEEMAMNTDRPAREINKEAYRYLDEIAADYSMNWIMTFDLVLNWMLKHIFDGIAIDQDHLEKLKKESERTQAPMIFVPTHKSHLDYLILSYVLYHNHMACPHIAAGKNLSFWPMGPAFRGGGAFFMRRTFKGQKLYAKVFLEYIYKLLQEGFHIEFFLEGTRSRTGKTLTPKVGLLSILLEAYEHGACRDMIFVPVNIGYDRIIEEAAYVHESEGGEKTAENLPALIKARKSLKTRYGKVYVNFNDPISLNDFLSRTRTTLTGKTQEDKKQFIDRLSRILINRIDDITTVTPYGIVSSAILNSPQKRFTYSQLLSIMDNYLATLKSMNVRLSDAIITDPGHAFSIALDSFAQRKLIERLQIDTDQDNPLYVVNESKRPVMEYYKNNCIIFFIPAAFTALAILKLDTFEFAYIDIHKQFEFLRKFFVSEFTLEADKSSEHFTKKSISTFIEKGILVPHASIPGNYNLTPDGLKKLKQFTFFLTPYFESYLIALTFLRQEQKLPDDKEIVKKALGHGKRMYKNNEIECLEAISTPTIKNALRFFLNEKLAAGDDRSKADYYEDTIRNYLMLLA